MTDGTYIGPSPVAQIPEDLVSSQELALQPWRDIDDHISGLQREIREVFLVGAGGSFLAMVPSQYLLDLHSSVPVHTYNSDEVRLPGAGQSRRTFPRRGAFRYRQHAGNDPGGPVGRGSGSSSVSGDFEGRRPPCKGSSDVVCRHNRAGQPDRSPAHCHGHPKQQGFDTTLMHSALTATPKALFDALASFEPEAARIAAAMKDVPVTNVLASGPLQGAAETFTMCYLQEMQWMHAATINADEFFQGPFEVIDKDMKTIVFLGEDKTRPMGERVRKFLETYSGETFYIDAAHFELPGPDRTGTQLCAPLDFPRTGRPARSPLRIRQGLHPRRAPLHVAGKLLTEAAEEDTMPLSRPPDAL